MSRITTAVVFVFFYSVPATGQAMPDTVGKVLALHHTIERFGSEVGPLIWPGFRPDTIPTLYVIANRGKLLVQWRHDLPSGFVPVPGIANAGWSSQESVSLPSGRFISFMSVDSSMTPAYVVGTSVHEAFHSFERSMVRDGIRFGGGENAMLIGTYPVFDVDNEAAFALEGQTLGKALQATSIAEARRYAGEFLAIRGRRRSRLPADMVEFERMAEMNEGLAQYALLRGLEGFGRHGEPWRSGARLLAQAESGVLDSLLGVERRSVRRRFYATGSAMALLLDRVASADWKQRLMEGNKTIEEMLSEAVDPGNHASLGPEGEARMSRNLEMLRPAAARAVEGLRHRRQRQADSLLAAPGLRVVLDPSALNGSRFQWCGFDPQNTLQTGDGRTLHMRFLNVCGGSIRSAEFSQPVVENESGGSLETVIANPAAMVLTEDSISVSLQAGETKEVTGLQLEAPGLSLRAGRATLRRENGELRIVIR